MESGVAVALTEPAGCSPEYDQLVDRHGLEMLRKPGDLSIVNGDFALTKDGDLMLGDVAYNALFRLVEHWRHNAPHMEFLYALACQMLARHAEAQARLDLARAAKFQRRRASTSSFFERSPEFMEAWDAHWGEEGAAVFGHRTYSGCVVLLASSALLRFRDDFDVPSADWDTSGSLLGGCSVGQVVVAAANGFRHEDEWAKTRVPTSYQKRSMDVLDAALGPRTRAAVASPGRCPEVLFLLADGRGFEGLTGAVLGFAHEVAQRRRAALRAGASSA